MLWLWSFWCWCRSGVGGVLVGAVLVVVVSSCGGGVVVVWSAGGIALAAGMCRGVGCTVLDAGDRSVCTVST